MNMKIKLLSDLHLEHFYPGEMIFPGSGDVLILAGDILTAKSFKSNGHLHEIYDKFISECSANFSHILYVLGNHEHYGYVFQHTANKIQQHLPDNFRLLNNDKFILEEWVFLGATFWTDHHKENPMFMMENKMKISDYSSIRITNYRKLIPDDTLVEHKKSKEFFEHQLEIHKNDNVFIITHMAPSYQSIAEEFRTSAINSSFASDLDYWILERPQIKYWAHGHVHSPFDYMIGECRVMCNPHGYRRQSSSFNLNFEINI